MGKRWLIWRVVAWDKEMRFLMLGIKALRHKEMRFPTLQDVALLMGLRVHGVAVTGYGNYDWDQVCFQLLGEVPEEADRQGATLQLAWLRDRFSLPPPDNATELVLSHYARAYILYMMGSTLFTTTSGDSVSYCICLFFITCIRLRDIVGEEKCLHACTVTYAGLVHVVLDRWVDVCYFYSYGHGRDYM